MANSADSTTTTGAPSERPIRVALCITELNVGGAERCLTQIALRLPRPEFSPTVFSLGPPPPAGRDELVEQLRGANIPVHFLHATDPRHAWRTVNELTAHWRRQTPHVVQTFLFHANLIGRIAARRAGVRAVASGIRVAQRNRAWHLWADRHTQRWVRRHVCVSDDVARFSRDVARLDPAKITVVPNAVDVTRFDSAPPFDLTRLGVPPGRQIMIYIGRFDDQKRVDWLLRLMPGIFERLPRHDLLLVGDGPQREALQRATRQTSWHQRVHWAGWRDDVPSLLRASALLVLPSAWEGFPNVVLEAMASRLPVVATATEGVTAALAHATAAQVVAVDDAAGFAERVVEILSNESLRAQLGAANRTQVEARFGVHHMVASYVDLYRQLALSNG